MQWETNMMLLFSSIVIWRFHFFLCVSHSFAILIAGIFLMKKVFSNTTITMCSVCILTSTWIWFEVSLHYNLLCFCLLCTNYGSRYIITYQISGGKSITHKNDYMNPNEISYKLFCNFEFARGNQMKISFNLTTFISWLS